MKTLKIILLTIVGVLVLNSCGKNEEDLPHKEFTLKLTYIDGVQEIKTWNLPSESKFSIETSQGSYSIHGYSDQCFGCSWVMAAGVIRYEVISVK